MLCGSNGELYALSLTLSRGTRKVRSRTSVLSYSGSDEPDYRSVSDICVLASPGVLSVSLYVWVCSFQGSLCDTMELVVALEGRLSASSLLFTTLCL